MADHSELISEMPLLEKMSTQERLKLARKRRSQQMKKWSQREKEYNNKRKKMQDIAGKNKANKKNDYKVHFVSSVMLLEAAARNDVEEVRRLLMLGVSPDSTNEDGLTALHQCCIDDSEEMMKLLIDFGANVNAKDSEQWTPLHAAATCGHLHLVKYLISKGADLLAVNADGNMPYDICEDEVTLDYIESEMAKRGITQEMIDETRATIERLMLDDLKKIFHEGVDLETRDLHGATPLHVASANGYISVVEFLLDNHASTDVIDNDMWQPIHAAACWGHPDVLELLVQNGADLNAKTKNGETPFDICEDPELKERIIQLKSEMETKKATQPNKLKRSHSQNTRSHSIRRTSVRDKSQISRREALEEARIRHEKVDISGEQRLEAKDSDDDKEHRASPSLLAPPEETYPSNVVDLDNIDFVIDSTPQTQSTNQRNNKSLDSQSELSSIAPSESASGTHVMNHGHNNNGAAKKDAVVIRNTGYSDKDKDRDKEMNELKENNNANADYGQMQTVTSRSSSISGIGSGAESVKVEIHVTVNTTPTYNSGTLADLKKQRAERHRNSLTLSSSSPSESTSNTNIPIGRNCVTMTSPLPNTNSFQVPAQSQSLSQSSHNNSSHSMSATYLYQPPPSPSTNMKKFHGDASDIVGESKQTRRCCTIM